MHLNKVIVVLGAQWGGEGKGKLVDLLATEADVVCRYAGGNNAVGDKGYDSHLLPSGIINSRCTSIIGNGLVVHIPELFEEVEKAKSKGLKDWSERLRISDRAHLVFDLHQQVDGLQGLEKSKNKSSLSTTRRGVCPTYSSKASTTDICVCDLMGDFTVFEDKFRALVNIHKKLFPQLEVDVDSELQRYEKYAKQIRPMVCDTVYLLDSLLKEPGKRILVEGTNSTLLSRTYPYVTSSNCSIAGVCTGLGIPLTSIGEVYGVVKAYTTMVEDGAFPTEQLNEFGELLQSTGQEFGVTTKRRRRCGWLDVVLLKYVHGINGFNALAMTKLDILDIFDDIKIGVEYLVDGKSLSSFPAHQDVLKEVEVEYVTMPGWNTSTTDCRKFEDLPVNAQKYVRKAEELIGIPIKWVGIGKSRDSIIQLF